MAKYTADRTLVQGARDVGRSMMPVDTSGLDKIIETGTKLGVASLDEKRKKAQKKVDAWDAFGKDAEKVLLDGGSLGEALYGDTVNFTKQAKEDYLAALKSGDETAQFAAKKALQDRSLFTQSHKATIQEISALRNPKEGEPGLSKGHSEEQISTMSDIISGRYTVGKNKDDVMVFKLSNGKEVTNAEFESMAMVEHLATGHELGKQIGDVKNSEMFNEAASRNGYSKIIPKTEKEFIASMHDDLGGQGGENNLPNLLRQDFKSGNLENEIKSALGQDMYNRFDTDGIPGLSNEEKDNFIDTITNPENENFDLNTSRTIFVDKMVDATRNAHATYWNQKTETEDKKRIQALKDKQTLKRTKSGGTENKVTDTEYTRGLKNKQVANSYNELSSAIRHKGWKGSLDLKERAKAEGYGDNDGPFAWTEWYRTNVNAKHKIEWLGGGRDKTNIISEYGDDPIYQNLQPGFYRMMQDGVDADDNPILKPILFSKGEKMLWNNIPNTWIDYDNIALENVN